MRRLKYARWKLTTAQDRLYRCRRNLMKCSKRDRANWAVAVKLSEDAVCASLDMVWAEQNLERIKRR